MRVRDLVEATSFPDAVRIFRKFTNVDPTGLSKQDLRTHYRKAAERLHPDRPTGDLDAMQKLNDAYDVLAGRKGGDSSSSGAASSRAEPAGTPEWAWAGHSGGAPPSARISREDYRDINYIKKRMWELSGRSKQQWSIEGFDGYFMRNSVTVFGSPKIFRDMAEAMIMWQTRGGNPYDCRAVLVSQGRSKVLKVIYADGEFYDKNPPEIEHESFNYNASNDSTFTRRLVKLLDELQANGVKWKDQSRIG